MASASFPIWRSIRAGYADTFRNLDKVLKLAWLPFLLAFSASYLVDAAYHVTRPDGMLDGPYFGVWTEPIMYARMIVIDCCHAIFALAIFRYRLLGWTEATDHVRLDLGKRELAFMSAAVLAFAVHYGLWSYFLVSRTLDSLTPYGGIELLSAAVFLTIVFILARLCFVLAAAAVRPEVTVRERRLSFSNWGALVATLLGTVGPFTLLRMIPSYLSYFTESFDVIWFRLAIDFLGIDATVLLDWVIIHVSSLTVSFLGIAVAVTAVSAAYGAQKVRQPSSA